MTATATIPYRSKINGIEFDVPEDEITNDYLLAPDNQNFFEPVDGVDAPEGEKTEKNVPKRAGGRKPAAKSQATVEIE